MGELKTANEAQHRMQTQIDHLQFERDILLEELERAGTISPYIRLLFSFYVIRFVTTSTTILSVNHFLWPLCF